MEGYIAALHNAKCRISCDDITGKAQGYCAEAASIAEEEEDDGEGEEEAVEGVEEEEEQEEEEGAEGLNDCVMGLAQENPKQGPPNKEMGASAGDPSTHGQCEAQQPVQRGAKRSRASTAKERISKMPPCVAGKRSSIYRGVTRHRWTGRYEAHLWDKSTWNQNQNKKGKQVYLGAYDDEEAAARAYDLAALKYWGPGTLINFPLSDYARDIDEMQSLSREDYLASLRRRSSGFSRGASKTKGVSRNTPNARWDPQFGRNFANTLPQLAGYDGAGGSSEYGALGCPATLINLCHFMDWLQPPTLSSQAPSSNHFKKAFKTLDEEHSSEERVPQRSPTFGEEYSDEAIEQEGKNAAKPWKCSEPYQLPLLGLGNNGERRVASVSALSALSRSSMFSKMEERLNAGKGQEAASTVISESAAEALAAALAMDDCEPSPVRGKTEKLFCKVEHNSSSYAGAIVQEVPSHPSTSLPLRTDHSPYLADPVPPCLWNPFNASISMSMSLPQ